MAQFNTKTTIADRLLADAGVVAPLGSRSGEERWVAAQTMREGAWQIHMLTAVAKAAEAYFECAVQDEAAERECCVNDRQHDLAKALRDALLDLSSRGVPCTPTRS